MWFSIPNPEDGFFDAPSRDFWKGTFKGYHKSALKGDP